MARFVCGVVLAAWLAVPTLGDVLPITVTTIDRVVSNNKPVRGFVATIDLTDPRVDIVVTRKRPAGSPSDGKLVQTDTWRQRVGATLAINANFFGIVGGTDADIVGLCMSDGVQVSPPRSFNGQWDPALVFMNDGTAQVRRVNAPAGLVGVVDGVAGVGASDTDADPGTLLVEDGVNLGATARVDPANRNPRTAAGVSADGNTLILAVIDGRQNNWSVGLTLAEMADLMIEFGADDAVNLDGGGSSSFVYDDGETSLQNKPSDGVFRGVASHLGIRLKNTPQAVPDSDRRKVRGAWLRPPGTLQQLEPVLDKLRTAGVQDLFLETFYWGLATNDSDVFADRFGYDYLAAAISLAAKRGIRTHAWLEAGYWSFGGSGNYILDANPDWKVVDYQGNTNLGDINGQVFVNLGNPGVQGTLGDYCTELATDYPGLWGVQTDYHRFPLDNNTGDSNPAPYSFDTWSRATFQLLTGFDPINFGVAPSGTLWNQYVSFQREGIADAAGVMHDSIRSADEGVMFSGAVFASAISSSSQIAKMQDWPLMAANGWLPYVVPMAYGFSTSSIRTDLQTANAQAGPATVVAGLAILTNASRPSIPSQLATAYTEGIHDFILFDASTLVSSTTMMSDLSSYLATNGPFQTGDFDHNGSVDALDRQAFYAAYPGGTVSAGAGTLQFDLNNDFQIDADDAYRFDQQFKTARFGIDGRATEKDRLALMASFVDNGGAVSSPLPLYDLNGDGNVNCADEALFRTMADGPLSPSADINGDGVKDNGDITVFLFLFLAQNPTADFNRDGIVDNGDIAAFITLFLSGC